MCGCHVQEVTRPAGHAPVLLLTSGLLGWSALPFSAPVLRLAAAAASAGALNRAMSSAHNGTPAAKPMPAHTRAHREVPEGK